MDGVDAVVGIHLISMYPLGQVSAQAGPLLAAADSIVIEIRGRGGHAAYPHTTVDPVVVAAQVITALQQIVSREVDPLDNAVVSVTRVDAGTADNIIPEVVRLSGTVRTFRAETRAAVRAAIERILRGVTEAHGASFTFEYLEGYDAVVNDAAVAEIVAGAARADLGDESVVEVAPIMGGEDFSAYLKAAPGAFFFVGAQHDEHGAIPHHNPNFVIDEAALRTGITVFARTALDVLSG